MEKMMIFTPIFAKHWQAVKPIFSVQNEAEYDAAIERLNDLIDAVGTDESHPLYTLLDTLGMLIYNYEERHEVIPDVDGADVLAYLMEEHDLRQSDLPEIGSQGVVSEILHHKRELNVRQIRALSQRFSVSPAVFV